MHIKNELCIHCRLKNINDNEIDSKVTSQTQIQLYCN